MTLEKRYWSIYNRYAPSKGLKIAHRRAMLVCRVVYGMCDG